MQFLVDCDLSKAWFFLDSCRDCAFFSRATQPLCICFGLLPLHSSSFFSLTFTVPFSGGVFCSHAFPAEYGAQCQCRGCGSVGEDFRNLGSFEVVYFVKCVFSLAFLKSSFCWDTQVRNTQRPRLPEERIRVQLQAFKGIRISGSALFPPFRCC